MSRTSAKWLRYLTPPLQAVMAARNWLLAYIALILLPAGFLLYSYYEKSGEILEQEVTKTMLQTVRQTGINIQYQLDRVRDTSNSVFMNPYLYTYLAGSENEYPIDVMKGLRSLIDAAETNENISRIRLFVDSSKLYAAERINLFPLTEVQTRPWYASTLEAGGSVVWTGAYRETYLGQEPAYVFSSTRMLRDPNRFDRLAGVLVVDMKEQTIRDLIGKVELSKQKTLFIVDRDGNLIWHPNRALLGKPGVSADITKGLDAASEGIMKKQAGDGDSYTVFTTIPSTGWKLVAEVPAAEISRQALTLNRYSGVAALLGISVLFLLLVFVLLAFIIRGMNRRVQLVIRSIHREGIERLDEDAREAGNLNLLERSVDHMMHKVKDLMEETYTSKVQEREAQLRALQAQINPHFLYNTLDTINWIAVGRGAHDISQMIDGLAKYFRLSLNKGRDTVSVEDELSLAKVYLDIQQSRFPHSFEYTVNADPAVYPFMMPKLTLQPIVENALMHGIRKSKAKKGVIRLAARMDGADLLLSVSDDGAGMEEETAATLLSGPQPENRRTDSSGSSYGLYNVQERIRLFCGDDYGLSIHSRPDEGTTVYIRIKAIQK